MAQITFQAKQELLQIIKDIREGKLLHRQKNFYHRTDAGRLFHCVGGWYIVKQAQKQGIRFDDWFGTGSGTTSNKWDKFTEGWEAGFLRKSTGCEEISLITDARLSLDEIKQNIMEMDVIGGPQQTKETVQDKISRLEMELAEAKEELDSLPARGEKWEDTRIRSTYVVADCGFGNYGLINIDTGGKWATPGSLEDIRDQIKANCDFVKVS